MSETIDETGTAPEAPPPKRKPFVMLNNEFMRRGDISPGAKALYGVLLGYVGKDRHRPCWPGQERLSGEMGWSPKTVRKYLKELAGVGLIFPVRRGQGQTNEYFLEHQRALVECRDVNEEKKRRKRQGGEGGDAAAPGAPS